LADRITAYQAYRNRVVAGSIPALGTIFSTKNSKTSIITLI